MSDPDARPRPQYGEYASESEQRAHIREPLAEPAPTPLNPPVAPMRPALSYEAAAPVDPARAARQPDRIVTIVLLVLGALNVATSFFSFLDFATMVDRSYVMMGVDGSFSNFAAGKTWGLISALVLVAGYIATVVIARGRMKANKLAWFIPIGGAIVTFVVLMACVSVPLMSDPAFVEYVTSNAS
ncbi:DUF6264 family protein [Microbacterium sp. YY-03]|uniref:DUF6264 family protein n=1 Tax=Microbacterium sp. YY-03 TaxID=3421636 RepID=UPI003D185EEF